MHDAGAPTLSILTPIEVDVPWDELDSSASGLKTNSSDVEASMSDVGTSWGGLQAAYKQPASQETVWSAMDEVPGVVQDWADTMDSAGNIIQDFVTEGRPLQETAESLRTQAWLLEARLAISRIDIFGLISDDETDEDSQLRQDINQHNQDVLNFNSDWRSLENRISGRLVALHGASGRDWEIPRVYADGSARPGAPGGGFADSFDLGQIALAAGDSPSEAVEEAEELYGDAMAEGATGEDQQQFLDQIADMSAEEIEEFAERNEDANLHNLPAPSSEADLQEWPDGAYGVAWWDGMSEAQQAALIASLPLITGNVQGVPSRKRNEANLNALDKIRESGVHDEYAENLESIEDAALEQEGQGERFLLSLDVGTPHESRQPLAEISIGNPDVHTEVTYSTPGMNSGTHNMDTETDNAQRMYDNTSNQAVVAWMGYEPPTTDETIPESVQEDFMDSEGNVDWENITWEDIQNLQEHLEDAHDGLMSQDGSVMNDVRADEGGYRFAYAIDSRIDSKEARAEHMDTNVESEIDVNIVAHSYGTNMTAHALTRTDHDVDSVVFMGSSGIPEDVASSADELNIAMTGQGEPALFVAEAADDEWAHLGQGQPFGIPLDNLLNTPRIDPTDDSFGGYVFTADVPDQLFGGFLQDPPEYESVTGHSRYYGDGEDMGYLEEDTLAFETIRLILDGEWDSVEFESVPQ
ncbi:alpha/beta hydrolase [Nesterenkonia lacusekhoensis]|uniref:Gas vesicle protein n=1 Tax=Nesterenkonia lacusekhoensis TaxID=150832 RepID=A0ABS4T3G0_9MICC|nr:alpha/beta hydrolase [Nesterenkonia lacusekhoensis]MBP2318997.1 gas vesicle protein [Nesterenkonia lacusekhoensis]